MDLFGKGQADVLLLRLGHGWDDNSRSKIVAWSLAESRPIWEHFLWDKNSAEKKHGPGGQWLRTPGEWAEQTWFDVADLNGDGKLEVIVPNHDENDPPEWPKIEVLDGISGEVKWFRRLKSTSPGKSAYLPFQVVVGPDIDGDGFLELFASFYPFSHNQKPNSPYTYHESVSLFVTSWSGCDGHTLWWWQKALPTPSDLRDVSPLLAWVSEWHSKQNQHHQLFVSHSGTTFVLSAHNGRLLHELPWTNTHTPFN